MYFKLTVFYHGLDRKLDARIRKVVGRTPIERRFEFTGLRRIVFEYKLFSAAEACRKKIWRRIRARLAAVDIAMVYDRPTR